jgi:hypothetical protein
MSSRHILLVGMFFLLALTVGCVRNVSVPVRLRTEAPIPVDQLVARVNQWTEVERVQATVSLQFRDLRQAEEGKNKEYPAADGILVLSRPENIRLQIRAPFVGKRIADMVSDGQKFRVAVLYPDDKRKFLIGSNEGRYRRVESGTETDDPALRQAGALANIRPQHLTDAFLLRPLTLDDPDRVYFLDETQQTERVRQGKSSKTREAIRTYYVLTLLERVGETPEARVVRRLWFDRTRQGTPLARQELYEDGRLATVVRYEGTVRAEGRVWPERVAIERVDDDYSVEVIFEPSALTLNGELPEQVFTLENEDNLEEIDLDLRPELMEPKAATR